MEMKGWSPLKHFCRDFAVATITLAIIVGTHQLASSDSSSADVFTVPDKTVLLGIAAISATLIGTSILSMTMIIGWWDTGRLVHITSISDLADTGLLLLQVTTWILLMLMVLSVLLTIVQLPIYIVNVVYLTYVVIVITTLNYLRRTITFLYKAAKLVTKDP